MRDPVTIRNQVLNHIVKSSSRQLEESARNIEEIKSILHLAKSPKERTAINIILDDQKKVIRAIERLKSDLAEVVDEK